MTTSVNNSEKRSLLRDRDVAMIAKWSPTLKKEYFRDNILFPGGQISVRGKKRTKQREPSCVHISF